MVIFLKIYISFICISELASLDMNVFHAIYLSNLLLINFYKSCSSFYWVNPLFIDVNSTFNLNARFFLILNLRFVFKYLYIALQ